MGSKNEYRKLTPQDSNKIIHEKALCKRINERHYFSSNYSREQFQHYDQVVQVNELPFTKPAVKQRRCSIKKAKNDFLKSLHKKIIALTNNNNIKISSHNLNILDKQAEAYFSNAGILGEVSNTPTPQPKVLFNSKETAGMMQMQKIKSSENTNLKKPIHQAIIKGLYEIDPPQLGGILRSRKLQMNPDQFIDELLKKKYQQESLIEALKLQTTNNNFLDIDHPENKRKVIRRECTNSRQESFKRLCQMTKQTNRGLSFKSERKSEHKSGFSFNLSFK